MQSIAGRTAVATAAGTTWVAEWRWALPARSATKTTSADLSRASKAQHPVTGVLQTGIASTRARAARSVGRLANSSPLNALRCTTLGGRAMSRPRAGGLRVTSTAGRSGAAPLRRLSRMSALTARPLRSRPARYRQHPRWQLLTPQGWQTGLRAPLGLASAPTTTDRPLAAQEHARSRTSNAPACHLARPWCPRFDSDSGL